MKRCVETHKEQPIYRKGVLSDCSDALCSYIERNRETGDSKQEQFIQTLYLPFYNRPNNNN